MFNMLDQARTQMSFMANYLFDGYPLMGDSHSNFDLQKREREKQQEHYRKVFIVKSLFAL